MIEKIIYPLKKIVWRIRNKHNFTRIGTNFSMSKVQVGAYTYGTLNVTTFGIQEESLEIGAYCSIADNVKFLLSGEHKYNFLSTYPFKTKLLGHKEECDCKGKIIVGDDVWIGYGCTILSGVTIGQGAIIGACSTVAKNIPPYAIYANGRIIKYRFNEDIIKKLLKIDFSKIDKELILNNLPKFYENITENNVDEIIDKLIDRQ